MNQVSEEKKDAVTKTLAIVGFVAAILFAVWLAVQVVSIIPSAFSSLASLADSVYNNKDESEFIIANEKTVVNSSESTEISWTEMGTNGTYSFVYECTEGAALSIRSAGEIYDVNCGETVSLGTETKIELVIESEKQRFIDIPYTITYEPASGKDAISKNSKITVVNASIPTTGVVGTEVDPEPEVAGETTTESKPEENSENNSGYTGTGYTAGQPTTVERIVYTVPTSDPNGIVDLKVTYLGVGTVDGNKFVQKSTVDNDEEVAFQFEVKNNGTKTSNTWKYKATLPSGIKYDSNSQKALKPNEKAVITISADGISGTGNETFGAEIYVDNDVNLENNAFSWTVKVTG